MGRPANAIAADLGLTKGKVVGAARLYDWPRDARPVGSRVRAHLPDGPRPTKPAVSEAAWRPTPSGREVLEFVQPSAPRPRVGRKPARPIHDDQPRRTSDADRALIEAAIAAGKVTVVDPKVAGGVEIRGLQLKAEPLPDPMSFSWRKQIARDHKAAAGRASK